MLERSEKEEIVKELKQNIDKSQAIYLTNLVGLPSNDGVRIRRDVRKADGFVMIARNTLIERASKGTASEKILTGLKGPTAVVFAFGDVAAVAKVLFDAGKEFEAVTLKGGLLEDKVLTPAQVKELANLPSKPQMLATLLATFNAPVSAFVRVLDAIAKQKESAVSA